METKKKVEAIPVEKLKEWAGKINKSPEELKVMIEETLQKARTEGIQVMEKKKPNRLKGGNDLEFDWSFAIGPVLQFYVKIGFTPGANWKLNVHLALQDITGSIDLVGRDIELTPQHSSTTLTLECGWAKSDLEVGIRGDKLCTYLIGKFFLINLDFDWEQFMDTGEQPGPCFG